MIKHYDEIRKPMNLNGEWRLREDPAENGMYFQNYGNDCDWRKILVPSDMAHCFPERPYHRGVFWYKKAFTLDHTYQSRRIILHFDAVNYTAHVYVNGRYVGVNEQGFLPFDLEITDAVKLEEENVLIVRVDTRRKQGQLPSSFYWKNYGGILRDVCIYSTEGSYIEKAHVEAHADGKAVFYTGIVCAEENLTQKIAIKDFTGNVILETENEIHTNALCVATKAQQISLWSMEQPTLYRAEISLLKGDAVMDKKAFHFGYRDIEAKDGKLLLNGEEIFLRGFNRHEDHPQKGGSACEEVVQADFKMIKESGANFIRMCHYPHDERELEEADKLGLALLVEIPLCAYLTDHFEIDGAEHKPKNETVYPNARECLVRMIERDRNHPSVLIWSVSNENNEPEEIAVIDNHKALIQLAKKLDPTRLATHVSMHSRNGKRDQFFVYDDVICINTYPSLLGRYSRRDENYDFNKAAQMMRETIEGLKVSYPGKPIIVTEFGYRTGIAFDGIEEETMQAQAVKHEYLAARECANGASVWIFADHLWPIDPGLLADISRYGLLNRDRSKKEAFDVYSKLLQQG